MTTSDVLMALRRRWYVAVCGLLITAAAVGLIAVRSGVYWTQVDVVFLAPASALNPNVIEITSQSLIATAGLVERQVDRGSVEPATASSAVSLVGTGVRDGYSIQLPNAGGQWNNNFERAVLDVQVAGSSEQEVRARLRAVVNDIDAALLLLQNRDGVGRANLITTSSVPDSVPVYYLRGDPKRAVAAAGFLGLGLTTFLTVVLDRLALRRRVRRAIVTASPTKVMV